MNTQWKSFLKGTFFLTAACTLTACGKSKNKAAASSRPKGPSGTLSRESAALFLSQMAPQALGQTGATNVDGSAATDFTRGAQNTSAQAFGKNLLRTQTINVLADGVEMDDRGELISPETTPSPRAPRSPQTPQSPAPAASECTQISGDATDSDGDGFAVNSTTTFSCNESRESIILSMAGSMESQDKDDANREGGFRLAMKDVKFHIEGNGIKFKLAVNGSSEITLSEGSYIGSTNMEMTVNSTVFRQMSQDSTTMETSAAPTPQSADQDITLGYFFDTKITPTPGQSLRSSSGVLDRLSGFFKVKSNELDVVLGIEGQGLRYSDSCSNNSHYQDGTITFTDSSGNKAEVLYANCLESYTYNGEKLAL